MLFLTDVLPALDREIAEHALEQDHARLGRVELVRGAFGQQRHMAAPWHDVAHPLALGVPSSIVVPSCSSATAADERALKARLSPRRYRGYLGRQFLPSRERMLEGVTHVN